jgi:hypothetical protein
VDPSERQASDVHDTNPSVEELRAEARYAEQRLALYRQRIYAGGGNQRRLAELERTAKSAAERLGRAQSAP